MTNDEVKTMLRKHLDNITMVQMYLLNLDDINEEILESMCLPISVMSDMPKSVTNRINSITENVALNYNQNLTEATKEIHKLNRDIEKVEIALKRLKDIDRFLINKKWIEDLSWNEVGREFTSHYYYISGRNMKRRITKSLKKIASFL